MRKKTMMFSAFAVILLLVCAFPLFAGAKEPTAKDITALSKVELVGFENGPKATDGRASSGASCMEEGGKIVITGDQPIGALYMRFNEIEDVYILMAKGKQLVVGKDGFLHEYIDVEEAFGQTNSLTVCFHTPCNISEITVLSGGERPENMQVWNPVLEDADLLLFSSHSDDDQLFFAGVIPRYCAEGYRVQVAYLTNHPDWPVRRHELLDGLWAAGCKNYPVMGTFADFRIDDLDRSLQEFENRGTTYEDLMGFVVETTRRTKPSVVVSHDVEGEYGHGMHRILSKMVREQPSFCADPAAYPESAAKYGAWQVKKTYIHLYKENKSGMVLDIDTPLPYFGGKTAFQVSQASFLNCHPSQHGGWYFEWQQGTEDHKVMSSAELDKYNPAFYGLYQSTVGADVIKTDFFENLMSKAEMEEEAKRQLEEEKRREEGQIAELQASLLREQNKTAILSVALVTVVAVVVAGLLLSYLKKRRKTLP